MKEDEYYKHLNELRPCIRWYLLVSLSINHFHELETLSSSFFNLKKKKNHFYKKNWMISCFVLKS